jgi:hypothetical protein
MKRSFFIVIATLFFMTTYSQSVVDFSKFPTNQNDTTTLLTAELLDRINWKAIKSFCKTAQGHYAYENKDSLLISYKYIKQGYESSFVIVSYNGTILEYYTDAGNNKQTSYFGKTVWLKYVNQMLPSLSDMFKLAKEEPNNILKAYYRLLGVNTSDEYGFICEYSTVGRATERRMAIIELLQQRRFDLIKRLVNYPNLQTKLYAVDALIYNDYLVKQRIQELEEDIKQKQKQIDSFSKSNGDKTKVENLDNQIKTLSDAIASYTPDLLTADEWKMIHELRDSKQTVRTCGNAGSYKIYETAISDVLSDKAVADIPKLYDGLKSLGYFR